MHASGAGIPRGCCDDEAMTTHDSATSLAGSLAADIDGSFS